MTGLFEGMLFVVVASGVSQRASTDRLGQINLLAGVINGGILVLISALPATSLGRGCSRCWRPSSPCWRPRSAASTHSRAPPRRPTRAPARCRGGR